MNADGTFTAYPDAADDNGDGTVTFFYQLSGGDTAQVTLTFEAEEFLWFVDSTPGTTVCSGTNEGTQACPAATLASVTAADTVNDVIFIDSGTYAGVANTLENTELVIGNGSTSTLSALVASRVTPVAGSSFAPYDALNGAAPVFTCTNVTCLTLGTGGTLRGFSISDSGATGTDLAGTNFGTLTVDEVSLSGTGRALNLATGTILGTGFTSVTSTSSGTQGINLAGIIGTLNLGSNRSEARRPRASWWARRPVP
ncbi:MAG: hypothetical protein IPK97_02605 [Ahniella sp.]|nr:hypothetical protein [Ahniella sp.]